MSPRDFDIDGRVTREVKHQGLWTLPLERQRKDFNTQVLSGPVAYGIFAVM